MSKSLLGIAVAKLKLDVALLRQGNTLTQQFANSPAGFTALHAWLTAFPIDARHACLQATGADGDAVVLFLYQTGYAVSRVNPSRIKGYAQAQMQGHKTDRADAILIADFCLTQEPSLWQPTSPVIADLQAITRRLAVLEERLQAEQHRLDATPVTTRASVARMIATLKQEIADRQGQSNDHVDHNPELQEQQEWLPSSPGIGAKTAQLWLSDIDFGGYHSAREVAAFAGVTAKKRPSGSRLRQTNLCKLGNGRIRQGWYFPALVAKRHNQLIKEFAKRLEQNGKSQMQIVCAAMRKLLHIAFGVLKHRTPFNPDLAISG